VPFPDKALVADLACVAGPMRVASVHIPPGSRDRETKVASLLQVAAWLKANPRRTLMGIDANTPRVDHPDLGQSVWWGKGEEGLLGQGATHGARDTYRDFLGANPQMLDIIVRSRPSGPLATSHRRGHGKGQRDCRYDFVLATPDIRVHSVAYHYEAAIAAGSDHALVVAELEMDSATDGDSAR
jgi:endonuclease/exonuclease/phosphatase family metal-dependent hydrolase